LTYYKGIKNLFALTMITETGDVKRFPHPRQLASWIGMVIREYSSGGKHNRFSITKQGNRLLIAGKYPNKVKVACAREMVGFVRESLQRVAA
jgi:transposase